MVVRTPNCNQIHLSTAMILLLEIGILMWAMVPTRTYKMWSPDPQVVNDTITRREWGWPIRSMVSDTPSGRAGETEYVFGYGPPPNQFRVIGFVIDSCVALLILGITTVVCERKYQKTEFLHTAPGIRRHLMTVLLFGLIAHFSFIGTGFSVHYYFDGIVEFFLVAVLFEFSLNFKITGPILFSILIFGVSLSN